MEQDGANFIQRIPPNDAAAEQAVLCSMLYDREAIAAACEVLKSGDFYQPVNKVVFETMVELFSRSVPVDVVTLSDKLNEKGVFEQIGGAGYIAGLAGASYTAANIKFYSKIVQEKALLRSLIKAAGDISAASFEAREDVSIILDNAEKSIFDIAQNRMTSDFSHIRDILITSIDKLEALAKTKGQITGVPTGFIDFDNKTTGFQPSDLVLIGARPSMGKTALMLNVAQHAAVRKQIPTAFFSLEMSKEQIVHRLMSAEAAVDSQKLRTGDLHDEDWGKIANCMAPLSEAPLYIDDTPAISPTDLRAKCRRLKLEKGLQFIIIDYLQLMTGSTRTDSRQQEISEISRTLKAIAKELSVPVMTAAQLSRACEARADHRPMLSDLRESGAIEQDADVVAFLYRDEYYNPATEKKGMAELIIAKQRNGPTGTVDLMYFGQYTRFANVLR